MRRPALDGAADETQEGQMATEEKIQDRVRKLLATAEHPNTGPEERESALRMADRLMVKYAIDQALLMQSMTKEERQKPVSKKLLLLDPDSVWSPKFRTMLESIFRANRVRGALHYDGNVTVVGFQEDVDYCEMLWFSTYYAFLNLLEPKWNNDLTFEQNVYNFKEAGRKWLEICNIANANGHNVPWPDGGKLIRAYKKHCKKIGATPTPQTQRHGAYRESFADGFVERLAARLESLRAEAEAEVTGNGAELAIRDRKQDVNEMFYEIFPQMRPMTDEERSAMMAKYRDQESAEAKAREAMLARMTEKQRAIFFEKEERERRRQAAASDRFWREQSKKKTDIAGRLAGRAAADTVDLARKAGSVGEARTREIG